MRVHLFPSRTQKLSSCTLTILGGRLPGKIGNANTEAPFERVELFLFWNSWTSPPVSCCGARCAPWRERHRRSPTAATRSGHFIRFVKVRLPPAIVLFMIRCALQHHRRRSPLSPSRTQKLSSCTLTILGGRLPGKIGNANTNLHRTRWRFLYTCILGMLPLDFYILLYYNGFSVNNE